MGDISLLLKRAKPIATDRDASVDESFWFPADETSLCQLHVPAQEKFKTLSYYMLDAQDIAPLPLQVPSSGFEDTAYIPFRTVARLLIVDESGLQVTTFDPPMHLSFLVTSEDIVTGQMLDMFLPETGRGVMGDTALSLARVILNRNWGDAPGLQQFFDTAVARWNDFFRNKDWQAELPERAAWLKSYFGLLVGSEPLSDKDVLEFRSRNWHVARSRLVAYEGGEAFDTEHQGFVLTSVISDLAAFDPCVGKKRDSAR